MCEKREDEAMVECKGWAWLEGNGVRGVLNIQTGAFQVPCVVRVDRKFFKEETITEQTRRKQ